MEARQRNRANDLYEMGAAVAYAFHEPDKLKELLKVAQPSAPKEKGWWELDGHESGATRE